MRNYSLVLDEIAPKNRDMTPKHLTLAVLVTLIWGTTFPLITIALEVVPPFLLVALRYAIVAIPTLLFVPFPKMRLGWFFGYAISIGVVQFTLLYAGIAAGMPAGLASVVLQAVAPFTVILSVTVLRQRITGWQWAAVCVSAIGLIVITVGRAQVASVVPLVLLLAAALSWAIGNVASSRAGASNAVHMALWSCVIPPIPMAFVTLAVDGPRAVQNSLQSLFTADGLPALLSVLAIGLLATAFGYGTWTWLLEKYSASVVAPLSMLVPVTGMGASLLILHETIGLVEGIGASTAILGVLGGSIATRLDRPSAPSPQLSTRDITPEVPALIPA
jgi:O-acetylserine/cysteine efflux transporter